MNDNKLVINKELLVSNMLEIQALIRILEKKGITNQDEILDLGKKLQVEMEENIRGVGRENWDDRLHKTQMAISFNSSDSIIVKYLGVIYKWH